MKMYQVVELNNFYPTIKDMKIPVKTAYKFARLMSQVEKEVVFYQDKFNQLILEYGQYDANGQLKMSEDNRSIAIIPGKEKECNDKIAELRNLEVELGTIKFTIDELSDLDLSISDLTCLMPLIEE